MPELPELQAHAERLTDAFGGATLEQFVPLSFTALKTATPPPEEAYGHELVRVGRRGKYLLLDFDVCTFVVHLMQGGRLLVDEKARLLAGLPDPAAAEAPVQVVVAGSGRYIQIWRRDVYEGRASTPGAFAQAVRP